MKEYWTPYNNRVPVILLNEKQRAALEKAMERDDGLLRFSRTPCLDWEFVGLKKLVWNSTSIYRARPPAQDQDTLTIDWDQIDPRINWIAKDRGGTVYGYRHQPVLGYTVWFQSFNIPLPNEEEGYEFEVLHELKNDPDWIEINWEKSLRQRPPKGSK